MDLPRDDIAFRKVYEPLVVGETLTTVFRPGNRIYPNNRGYKLGEILNARIIEVTGNDSLNIAPKFNETKKKVRVKEIKFLDVNDLKEQDFIASSPDVTNVESLKYHLGLIYNLNINEIKEITKIVLEYV